MPEPNSGSKSVCMYVPALRKAYNYAKTPGKFQPNSRLHITYLSPNRPLNLFETGCPFIVFILRAERRRHTKHQSERVNLKKKKKTGITMASVLELKTRKRKDYKFNLEYRTRWYCIYST